MTEREGTCETCDHRRQEPETIDGRIDIAWFCDEFDYYVPPNGWCWLWQPIERA